MRIEECPVKAALDVIGGKWKPLILFALKERPRRYGELRREVTGAPRKVFTEQLRQLEAAGVVEREVLPGAAPHTQYSLSVYGETLRPVLEALAEWGAEYRERAAGIVSAGATMRK